MPMVIGMGLILLAIGYYFYTSGGNQAADQQSLSFDVSSDPSQSGAVGSDILALLKKIHQLNIDYRFFDPNSSSSLAQAQQSLYDFSQPIPSENIGRSNPFLPIDGAGVQGGSGASTTPPISKIRKK